MNERYRVTLTADERAELIQLLARGKADVRKLRHAQMLMKADESDEGPGWPEARIARRWILEWRRSSVCADASSRRD